MDQEKWYLSKILKRNRLDYDFPILHLDPSTLFSEIKLKGVYAGLVRYDNKIYSGVLYFGPRLNMFETHTVLDVYIIHFKQEVSGNIISFQLKTFIRKPEFYESFEVFKKQLLKDIHETKNILDFPLAEQKQRAYA